MPTYRSFRKRKSRRHRRRPLNLLKFFGLGLLAIFLGNLLFHLAQTFTRQDDPIDAILVLGGPAEREVYAAQLAVQHPDIPVLISQGSQSPCLKEIFRNRRGFLRESLGRSFLPVYLR